MEILHIDSSPSGSNSISRQLTAEIISEIRKNRPRCAIRYRDLVADAPRHLTPDIIRTFRFAGTPSPDMHAEVESTEALIEEFLAHDTFVIGAPMFNFGVPTQLKAWIDRIMQPGRTFRFTPTGPVGLCQGKSAIIASSRGSAYAGTPLEVILDHQEAHLKAVFGFLGFTSIEIVRAEGLEIAPEMRHRALEDAQGMIRSVINARFAPPIPAE